MLVLLVSCFFWFNYFNIVGWIRCDIEFIVCVEISNNGMYCFVVIYNCIYRVGLNIFSVVNVKIFVNKCDFGFGFFYVIYSRYINV